MRRKIILTSSGYDPALGRAVRDPALDPAVGDLNTVPFTDTERAAATFVRELAAHVDENAGRKPTRETQKRVAREVRKQFFDK